MEEKTRNRLIGGSVAGLGLLAAGAYLLSNQDIHTTTDVTPIEIPERYSSRRTVRPVVTNYVAPPVRADPSDTELPDEAELERRKQICLDDITSYESRLRDMVVEGDRAQEDKDEINALLADLDQNRATNADTYCENLAVNPGLGSLNETGCYFDVRGYLVDARENGFPKMAIPASIIQNACWPRNSAGLNAINISREIYAHHDPHKKTHSIEGAYFVDDDGTEYSVEMFEDGDMEFSANDRFTLTEMLENGSSLTLTVTPEGVTGTGTDLTGTYVLDSTDAQNIFDEIAPQFGSMVVQKKTEPILEPRE